MIIAVLIYSSYTIYLILFYFRNSEIQLSFQYFMFRISDFGILAIDCSRLIMISSEVAIQLKNYNNGFNSSSNSFSKDLDIYGNMNLTLITLRIHNLKVL